jgi:hypothetical protein
MNRLDTGHQVSVPDHSTGRDRHRVLAGFLRLDFPTHLASGEHAAQSACHFPSCDNREMSCAHPDTEEAGRGGLSQPTQSRFPVQTEVLGFAIRFDTR